MVDAWVRIPVAVGMVVLAVAVVIAMARLAGLTRRLDKLNRRRQEEAAAPDEPPISGNSK